jgi:hypothetical protein
MEARRGEMACQLDAQHDSAARQGRETSTFTPAIRLSNLFLFEAQLTVSRVSSGVIGPKATRMIRQPRQNSVIALVDAAFAWHPRG